MMNKSKEREFVKQLYLDWANYYQCVGSPTKTKDINKAWSKWTRSIKPDTKKKVRQWCKK